MGETLYGALGVAEDAGPEAIRAAYRERVKEFHPDVADDPDATRTFKRLTTARDVLTDDAERARYDRLGHDVYVSRHVGSDLWESPTSGGPEWQPRDVSETGPRRASADGNGRASGPGRHRRTEGARRAAWLGEDWEGPRDTGRRGRARTAGGAGSWQMASEAYRSTPRRSPAGGRSRLAGAREVLGALGPWLAVHLAFIGSAVATGWFTLARPHRAFELTLPGVVVGSALVLGVVVLSALHAISLIYS